MELITESADLSRYLDADEAVDFSHPLVRQTAARLRAGAPEPYDYAERAFVHVRDTVPHSADTGDQRVTWRASDVLEQRTGICHAKAHALTALLRAEGIPAGLCYQRLTEDDGTGPEVHGLIALLLPGRPAGHASTRAATSPASTPASTWTGSAWPGRYAPGSASGTTRRCTRRRPRRSWPRCERPRAGRNWCCPENCPTPYRCPDEGRFS